jgi:sporulation protein YlmC with PRC-barrel domain
MVNPRHIRRGMQVYDANGRYVGFVTDVLETALLVRSRWRHEREIPLERVLAVLDQRVVLGRERQAA